MSICPPCEDGDHGVLGLEKEVLCDCPCHPSTVSIYDDPSNPRSIKPDNCPHGKLFCEICDFEFILEITTARQTGHPRACRCKECATIRRDAKRSDRKGVINNCKV